MGCLNIKPSLKDASPKFHIEKIEKNSGAEGYLYRNHFRVYYIVKGYVTASADDGARHRLGYGDICIVPPDVRHTVALNIERSAVYAFTFSIDFVENILQKQAGTSGVLSAAFNTERLIVIAPVPAKMQMHLSHFMEFMQYEYEDCMEESELVLTNTFATVLCIFLGLLKRQRSERYSLEKNGIVYAISYIKQNYLEKLTPAGVAAVINMSEKVFIESFKKFSGHTFHDFLNKIRIDKAVEVLRNSSEEISFSELSYICGYDNYITFYRNFVKYTGTSPAKFSEISENRTYD